MSSRSKRGATLGIVAALVVTIVLIGAAFFFLARILGGDKQTLNATDAGCLTAARSILAVNVPANSAVLAPEFRGLGVNVPPDPNQPTLPPGAPDQVAGKFNIFAYNRAAGACALMAMNALEDGNPVGISNVDNLIWNRPDSLRRFGDTLNGLIVASGTVGAQTAQDFQRVASENNVSMLGRQSNPTLVSDLQFLSVTTGVGGTGGKANVYFNSRAVNGDPVLNGLANGFARDFTGSTTSTDARDPLHGLAYEQDGLYQQGEPLLRAYQPIWFNNDPRIHPIYLAACNPASGPHLIDGQRFNSAAARIGYAPCNSVQGQTASRETLKTNSMLTAVASAVVGSIYNEYPVTLSHDYVRLVNGPDARNANPASALQQWNPGFGGIYGAVNGANNIFNNALYPGVGGGIYVTNDNSFFEKFPPAGVSPYREVKAYMTYNTASTVGWTVDPNGHRPSLDPAVGYEFPAWIRNQYLAEYAYNPYRVGGPLGPPYWPTFRGNLPNQNFKKYGRPNNVAVYAANPNNAAVYQNSDYGRLRSFFGDQISPSCISTQYQPGSQLPQICALDVPVFEAVYDPLGNSATGVPFGLTLTDLEAAKGAVITNWVNATRSSHFSGYSFTVDERFAPSGSKVYNRALAAAQPTNTTAIAVDGNDNPYPVNGTVAFGAVSKPYDLLVQLRDNGAGCIDPDSAAQYNDPNTVLGKLYERCKQIIPSTTWTTVRTLLGGPRAAGDPLVQNGWRLDLGATQWIYSPDGINLTVSRVQPAFLNGRPEPLNDGTVLYNACQNDSTFNSVGNIIDADKGWMFGGNGPWPNQLGDNGLHEQPFESLTAASNHNLPAAVDSYDYCTWQNSSGTNHLLGQMSFYNVVNADAQFSSPN